MLIGCIGTVVGLCYRLAASCMRCPCDCLPSNPAVFAMHVLVVSATLQTPCNGWRCVRVFVYGEWCMVASWKIGKDPWMGEGWWSRVSPRPCIHEASPGFWFRAFAAFLSHTHKNGCDIIVHLGSSHIYRSRSGAPVCGWSSSGTQHPDGYG